MTGLHGGKDPHLHKPRLIGRGNDLGVLHPPSQIGAGPFGFRQCIPCFGIPVQQRSHGAVANDMGPDLKALPQ